MKNILLWDLPTRICHWLLAAAVITAFVTQQVGGNAFVWHGRSGLLTVGLLVFRLTWGVIGSTYARFRQFVRGPAAIRAYLAGQWRGVGHNPLGALSVVALLGLLVWLALTGLFANDDIAFNGPLYDLVGKGLSDRLTLLHKIAKPILILLVLLHIGAIIYYARKKNDNLVKPMLSGYKSDAPPEAESARGGGVFAFLLALLLAVGSVMLASGVWLSAPAVATGGAVAW